SAILLTRQKLKELELERSQAHRGGYIAIKEEKTPELILLSSGSELSLAVEAANALRGEIDIRVVSMLSMERFDIQEESYKNTVLPDNVRKRFAVEAASSLSWFKYIGLDGEYLCIDRYGTSGPGAELFELYGFTLENLIEKIKRYMTNES
ncbi:MAG: transketolase, partial [Tissierellia bacterium]|nr:transketolase [Tissierellia bacterium]